MLCGEIGGGIHPHLDLTSTRSPYSALLNLYNMDTTSQDSDSFTENGLQSYENPNYHLQNIDDALNSNTEIPSYKQLLYSELESMCQPSITSNGRKTYASLDIGSMGVNLTTGPITCLDADNLNHRNSRTILDNKQVSNVNQGLDLKSVYEGKTKRLEKAIMNLDWNYEKGDSCKDVFELPDGKSPVEANNFLANVTLPLAGKDTKVKAPFLWGMIDNDGPYYWHIKSGTIQRSIPVTKREDNDPKTPLLKDAETVLPNFHQNTCITSVTRSNTSSTLSDEPAIVTHDDKEDMTYKKYRLPVKLENEGDKVIRFAVRSLGWVDISEMDLTPEKSSKAVNKCIVELSLGKNGFIDNVGRWGDGKDLFMDLDEGALKLVDPENLNVLNTQPIHTIRVWGVGRDNGRDFAYVARDRSTRKHMCHVFRCDMPARTIANTLRDICKKIMIERSLQQNLAKPVETNVLSSRSGLVVRPTNLPTEQRKFHRSAGALLAQSFPTPMEEPKKILQAEYLGNIEVSKPSGIDVLNDAIHQLMNSVPRTEWQSVSVSVAPSMISISPVKNEEGNNPVIECRVRYLSFLGIGQNVKQCAFIMHTAQDLFIAHVLHCEPSSGALCKTIEAACKLRYQKCLDAHPQSLLTNESQSLNKGISATLKFFMGSITGRGGKKS